MKRLLHAFETALLEILGTRELLLLAIVSVVFYAFYYPAPYSHQQATGLRIVAVDHDDTRISRAIVRELDDTRAVQVIERTTDMAKARRALRARRADGIVLVSHGFATALLEGDSGAGAALILNGAYFVRATAIARALGSVVSGEAQRISAATGHPMNVEVGDLIKVQPLFNTTGGYRDYVFPAIANIILQQTLLFTGARLIAERRRRRVWRRGVTEALGIWAALIVISLLGTTFFFGFAYWIQDVPRGGNMAGLLLALPLFGAAVGALGLLIGSAFRNGDNALKLLMPMSVPLVFLTGFAWPLDQMPHWLALLAWLSPATAAMHVFVPFNQMGASIAETAGPLAIMAVLALVYGTCWLIRSRSHR